MQHVLYLWWSRVSGCPGLIFSAQCPLVQFTALEAPLSFIMVDRTVYADKDHTPEQAVRNIFGRQRAPAKVCLLFAGSGLLTFDRIAQLGEDPATVRRTFSRIVDGDDKLGAQPAEQECNWLTVLAVWQSCKVLVTAMASRHAKILEDPTICLALPQDDHVDFRERFMLAHPDMIMVECREPHKKFVERISRDVALHGSVPFYEVGEMRLRSESIAQKTSLAPTADHLVKMARIDEAIVAVSSEEELMDRLNGFFVALEYLVVCEFSVKDGPITYIKELQAFRRETPGLAFLVQADKLFRKEIARLTSDERSTFTSFSQALLHVLQNCKHIWIKAKSEATLASLFQAAGSAPGTPSGGCKWLRDADHETIKADAPLSKRKKKQAAQAKKASAKAGGGGGAAPKAKAKAAPKGGGSDGSKPKVPAAEWSQLIALKAQPQAAKKCKFFNCSLGCKLANCRQEHVCLLCGEAHSWADVHFK